MPIRPRWTTRRARRHRLRTSDRLRGLVIRRLEWQPGRLTARRPQGSEEIDANLPGVAVRHRPVPFGRRTRDRQGPSLRPTGHVLREGRCGHGRTTEPGGYDIADSAKNADGTITLTIILSPQERATLRGRASRPRLFATQGPRPRASAPSNRRPAATTCTARTTSRAGSATSCTPSRRRTPASSSSRSSATPSRVARSSRSR